MIQRETNKLETIQKDNRWIWEKLWKIESKRTEKIPSITWNHIIVKNNSESLIGSFQNISITWSNHLNSHIFQSFQNWGTFVNISYSNSHLII